MSPMKALFAQGGGKLVGSRRNFCSSSSSGESKGERVFGKLIAAARVGLGVASVGAGFGIGYVVMRDRLFGPLDKEVARRKAKRESRGD